MSAKTKEKRDTGRRLNSGRRDLQMVRLVGVQVVPVAALGRQRSGGLWLGCAGRRGAPAEAPLGGVGDRDRRPTALLM